MATNDDKLQNLINKAISDYAYGQDDEFMDKASLERLSQIVNAQEPVAQKKVDIFGDGVNGVNVHALRVALQGYNDVKPSKYSTHKHDFNSAKGSFGPSYPSQEQNNGSTLQSTLNPTLNKGHGHLSSSANDNSVAPAAGIVPQSELAQGLGRANQANLQPLASGQLTHSSSNSRLPTTSQTSANGADEYPQIGLRAKNNLLGSHHVPVDYQEQFGSELGKAHERMANQAVVEDDDSIEMRQDPAFKDFITPQLMERKQRAAQARSVANASAAHNKSAHNSSAASQMFNSAVSSSVFNPAASSVFNPAAPSATHTSAATLDAHKSAATRDSLTSAANRDAHQADASSITAGTSAQFANSAQVQASATQSNTQSYRYTSASLEDGPFGQSSSSTRVQVQVGYTPKAYAQVQAQAQAQALAAAQKQVKDAAASNAALKDHGYNSATQSTQAFITNSAIANDHEELQDHASAKDRAHEASNNIQEGNEQQFSSASHITVSSSNSNVNNQARYNGDELYTRQSSSTIITKMESVLSSALASSSDKHESHAALNTVDNDQSVQRKDAVQSHSEKDFDVNSFSAITSATTGRKAYAAQRAAHMQGSYVAPSILDTHASTDDDDAQDNAQNDAAYSYTNRMSRSNSRSAVSPQIGRQAPRANTKLNAVSFGPAATMQEPQSGQYISAVNPYEQTQIEAAKQGNESYGLTSNTGFGALTHEYDAHRSAGSVVRKNIKKQSMRDIAGYAVQNDYGFSSPASRSNGAFKTSDTNDLRDASALGDQLFQRAVSSYERIPAQSSSTLIVRSKPAIVQDKATVFVTASGNKTIVGVESNKPVVPLKTAQVQKSESLEAEADAEACEETKLEEISQEFSTPSSNTPSADVQADHAETAADEATADEATASAAEKSADESTDAAPTDTHETESEGADAAKAQEHDAQAQAQAQAKAQASAEPQDDNASDSKVETKATREVVTAIVRDASYEVKYAQEHVQEATEQTNSPTRIVGVVHDVPERKIPTDAVRIVRSKAAAFTPSLEGDLAAAHGTIFAEQEFKGSVIGKTPAEFLKAKPSAHKSQEDAEVQAQAPVADSDFLENELLVGNSSTRIVTSSQRLKQNFARSTKLTEDLEAQKREQEAQEQKEAVPATIISVHDFMHKIELTAAQALAAAQASANAYAMIEADSEVTEARAGKNYGFAETSLILPKLGQPAVNTGEEHIPDYAKVPVQIHAEPKHRKASKASDTQAESGAAQAAAPQAQSAHATEAHAAVAQATSETQSAHVALSTQETKVVASAPQAQDTAVVTKVVKSNAPVKTQESANPVKAEPKAEHKVKPQPQTEPKVASKAEAKAEIEQKTEPKVQLKAEAQVQTAAASLAQSVKEPKTDAVQQPSESTDAHSAAAATAAAAAPAIDAHAAAAPATAAITAAPAQEQKAEAAVESIVSDDSSLEIKVKRQNKHNKGLAEHDKQETEAKSETQAVDTKNAPSNENSTQSASDVEAQEPAQESKVSTIVYQQDEEVPYEASKDDSNNDYDDPVKAASAAVREALHAQAEAHNADGLRAESAQALSGSAVDNAAAVPEHNLLEGVSADTDLTSSDDVIDKVVDLGKVSDGPIASKDVVMSALSQGASKDYDIVDTKQVIRGNRKNKNRNSRKRR